MNELILKLVKQTISDVDYIRFTDAGELDELLNDELSNMYIPDCFAEKFAELIVRECMKEVRDESQHAYNYKFADVVTERVFKHFGVEE